METLDQKDRREVLDAEAILGQRELEVIQVTSEHRDHLERAEKMEIQDHLVFPESRDPLDQRGRRETRE